MKILASFIIIVLISLFIVANGGKSNDSLACAKLEEFKKEEYGGRILRKYFDQKNHRAGTIVLTTNNRDIILPKEPSEFYNFIQPNDSIVKRKGTDSLVVYRSGTLRQFKIDYGCNE